MIEALLMSGGSGMKIKSVQKFTFDSSNPLPSQININEVDPLKTYVLSNQIKSNNPATYSSVHLSSGTTIDTYGFSTARDIEIIVLEFSSGVMVQRGNLNLVDAEQVNILDISLGASVIPENAISSVTCSLSSTNDAGMDYMYSLLEIDSPSTAKIYKKNTGRLSGTTANVSWQVLEFL